LTAGWVSSELLKELKKREANEISQHFGLLQNRSKYDYKILLNSVLFKSLGIIPTFINKRFNQF